MAPPRRQLRATPSNAADLSDFQQRLLGDLRSLETELYEQRKPFTDLALEYQAKCRTEPGLAVTHVASLRERLRGCGNRDAVAWASGLLSQKPDDKLSGIFATAVLQWRFDDASLWRGQPDNPRVAKIAKSIIGHRFRQDSIIASRTLSMKLTQDHLTLGCPHVEPACLE
jgi:hypothetical protein